MNVQNPPAVWQEAPKFQSKTIHLLPQREKHWLFSLVHCTSLVNGKQLGQQDSPVALAFCFARLPNLLGKEIRQVDRNQCTQPSSHFTTDRNKVVTAPLPFKYIPSCTFINLCKESKSQCSETLLTQTAFLDWVIAVCAVLDIRIHWGLTGL